MKIKLLLGALLVAGAFGCAAEVDPSNVDPSVTAEDSEATVGTSDDELAALTYKQTGAVITKNCGGCHGNLTTLAGVSAKKAVMIARISSGSMPPGKPAFGKSAAGKKVLKWLQTGTDL
jgi:mono/diheme cytochrome c family protein